MTRWTLNETALKNIINEAVKTAVKNLLAENYCEESSNYAMPDKLKSIFKNRVEQASHFSQRKVEQVVRDFYEQFSGRVKNPGFSLDYLTNLADSICSSENFMSNTTPNATEPEDPYADELDENILRKIVAESIKKVLKEGATS